MKHILLAGWILATFFTVSFVSDADENVKYAELKTGVAPQWGNLKNTDIIPCPKEITIYDKNIAIDKHLAIALGKNPSGLTKIAASDLQRLILKQTSVKIPVVTYSPESQKNNLIVLGTLAELPDLQKDCDNANISFPKIEGQGYAIFPAKRGDSQNIVLLGKDNQGVYWSAMTLLQLINDKTIRLAKILDWPDFKNRVCETLLTPVNLLFMAKDEQQKAKAWELIKAGVDEAARLKFNYIRCFAVLYSQPLTDYPLDKRAEILGEVGKYVNARGMRLYLNISVVVATQGDEKQFPQLKDCARFLHLYASWSDEELLSHACDKIARMAKIIGPQHYFLHSPDIPNMGWNSRSESDKRRWGDDRLSAEAYLINRAYRALKQGAPNAEASYVSSPYGIGCTGNTQKYSDLLKMAGELSRKLDKEIWLLWREGSLESAQKLRTETKNEPQSYYIENSSFHSNRLVGGTARTAKTYYFKNGGKDFFYDNCNTSGAVHKLQNYILSEYSWNTQAPGNLFVGQKFDEKYKKNITAVNGENWNEWINVHDLDGAVRETLIPRACRQLFGSQTGNSLALAYSVGSSFNESKLGGPVTIPSSRRYRNSLEFAGRLTAADLELAKLWGKPELFNAGTYSIYQSVFKYVFVYKYIEKINAFLMKLNVIAEDGNDKEQLPALIEECNAYIKLARQELTDGYGKYHWDKVPFPAIYGATLGDLNNVNKKIDALENAIAFKIKQIRMFGAGKIKEQKQILTGIAPVPKEFKLDGKLDEWGMDTANILDSGFYNRKVGKQGIAGPKDIIAYWKAAWDKSYLYLAVMVFDDRLSFEKQSPLHKNDAIEVWINEEQLIFSFTPEGRIGVESYGARVKDKIEAMGQIGDEPSPLHPDLKFYVTEIKIPIDYIQTAPETGSSFYFALGVDDVDKDEKPGQIVFPETYKHPRLNNPDASISKDFALAVLQDNANLTVKVLSGKISNIAKSDGTYTCINLNLSLKSDRKTAGVTGEAYLYAKDGIHRFKLDIPNTLEGEWRNSTPLQLDTQNYYGDDIKVDLIIRAPGFYKKFILREGKYRANDLGYQSRLELFDCNSNSGENSDTTNKNELLYEISFDNGTFDIAGGNKNKIASPKARGNTLVPGIKGEAIKLDEQGFLEYPVNLKLPEQGLIEFWFKPDYASNDAQKGRTLFCLSSSRNSKNRIFFVKNLTYSYMYFFGKNSLFVKQDKIKVDSWNYVGLQWDETKNRMQLNVNGIITAREKVDLDFTQPMERLLIGNNEERNQGGNSAIDEIRIWKVNE
jgi:hypothetical protein